ncbi:NAD(P)-dependent oxidoreductase [Leptospira sp. 96542]|nr:NAD(P)-dependent oxidoreductase [Leptospira sp. 96542]
MEMKQVSVIGGGIMGSGMAFRLLEAGHTVSLFVRNKERFYESNFNIHKYKNSPKLSVVSNILETFWSADLTILCLTTDDVVESAFTQVLNTNPNIILDTGTTSPDLTLKLNKIASDKNIIFADSPMTGSKTAANEGQILFMLGGDAKLRNTLDFFFDVCGKSVVLCGSISLGQKAKIALNLIQAGLLQVYMEGFYLAETSGISFEIFQLIVQNSAAASPLSNFKMDQIHKQDFSPHFALKNMFKDIQHAEREIKNHSLDLPMSALLKSIYEEGINKQLGNEDFSSLIKVLLAKNNS